MFEWSCKGRRDGTKHNQKHNLLGAGNYGSFRVNSEEAVIKNKKHFD